MSFLSDRLYRLSSAVAACLILTLLASAGAEAETWPERPVHFIVSQGAGSAQDISARVFGAKLSERWAQPVVIENRPGADGMIAITALLGAHDNHTLLFTASGTFAAHPYLHAKLPYDVNDLIPIAQVSKTVIAVAVPTLLNIKTLSELVDLARAQPDKLNFAPTPGTTEIVFDHFLKSAGITMAKIPMGISPRRSPI